YFPFSNTATPFPPSLPRKSKIQNRKSKIQKHPSQPTTSPGSTVLTISSDSNPPSASKAKPPKIEHPTSSILKSFRKSKIQNPKSKIPPLRSWQSRASSPKSKIQKRPSFFRKSKIKIQKSKIQKRVRPEVGSARSQTAPLTGSEPGMRPSAFDFLCPRCRSIALQVRFGIRLS